MGNLETLANNIREARKGNFTLNDKTINYNELNHAKIIIEHQNDLPPEKSYIFDKLDEIFMDQKAFTLQIDNEYKDKPFNCYNISKTDFDLYYDLNCAIEELVEAIRELNTKRWKRTKKIVNKEKVLEEIVDCTKFLNQAILRLGYNANDFYELHKKKSGVNRDRQKSGY
jgi:dimeric dUTPase (all-alpha-NTP-PPase superfamily)